MTPISSFMKSKKSFEATFVRSSRFFVARIFVPADGLIKLLLYYLFLLQYVYCFFQLVLLIFKCFILLVLIIKFLFIFFRKRDSRISIILNYFCLILRRCLIIRRLIFMIIRNYNFRIISYLRMILRQTLIIIYRLTSTIHLNLS